VLILSTARVYSVRETLGTDISASLKQGFRGKAWD